MAKPVTHYQVKEGDPNEYITVRNVSDPLTDNFKASEFWNPRVGQAEHPMGMWVINCVQLVRDWTGVPIKINSTYRNYIPEDGISPATISPHMLALACDFSFVTDQAKEDALYIAIRKDFEEKGSLFQSLWAMGCRGFGSYDTFIHLDTVIPELYPDFKAKRGTSYNGELYAYWNKMKLLRNRTATISLQSPDMGGLVAQPVQQNPIVQTIQTGAGVIIGTLEELFNPEDRGIDFNVYTIVYLVIIAMIVFSLGFLTYRGIKSIKS